MFIIYTCLSGVAVAGSISIKTQKLRTEHAETKTGMQELTERVD